MPKGKKSAPKKAPVKQEPVKKAVSKEADCKCDKDHAEIASVKGGRYVCLSRKTFLFIQDVGTKKYVRITGQELDLTLEKLFEENYNG
jgi:hypothetical protein